MILDGQNYLSSLASGDTPTAVADNASSNVIDQQVLNGIFSEGGGSYVGMFLKCIVQAAGASSGSGTIQVVLQDSKTNNADWVDRLLGPVTAAAAAVVGADLAGFRIPQHLDRYIRVVYRIGTAVFQTGPTLMCFLTPDQDLTDLSQREATGTVSKPTGALDESSANGVLNG